jgi:DNA-binding winged helix-turn-helix (wHTH) protein/TolB-like protein
LNRISSADRKVNVEPKAMDVLLCLTGHAGEAVSKEQIVQSVWSGCFVTDDVVIHAISELRKAFQDDAKNSEVIETIPKRGYRLRAPLLPLKKPANPDKAPDRRPADTRAATQVWKWVALGTIAVFLAMAIILIGIIHPAFFGSGDSIDSIAVLPLETSNPDSETLFLSDALASGISSQLSELSNLRVLPTYRLRRDIEGLDTLNTMAEQLGVRSLLLGRLRRGKGSLDTVFELYDAEKDELVWSARYETETESILDLENAVSKDVSSSLRVRMTPQQEESLTRLPTNSPRASEWYWRGRICFEEARYEEAVEYLTKSVQEDSEFAEAYIFLADSERMLGFMLTSPEHYRRAEMAARRALEIDPNLPDAHLRMSEVHAFHERDWSTAAWELKTAKARSPKLVSYHTTILLLWMNAREDALRETRLYEEQGDPSWSRHQSVLALRYYWLREFDRAIDLMMTAKREDPGTPVGWLLSWCCFAKGMEEEALHWVLSEPLYTPTGEDREDYLRSFAESGIKGVFEAIMDRVGEEGMKPIDAAGCYAMAGNVDRAFELLEKTYELPVALPFFADARFDCLRGDPRYERLLWKLRLPKEVIQQHLIGR